MAATTEIEGKSARMWDGKVVLEVEPRINADEIEIRKIEASSRRNGHGTQAMGVLKDIADQFGVAMMVEAIATAPDLTHGKVETFYKSVGFGNPTSNAKVMWREPVEQVQHKPKENGAMAAGPVAF